MVLLRNINQVWAYLDLVVAFKPSLVYQEGDKMEIKQHNSLTHRLGQV